MRQCSSEPEGEPFVGNLIAIFMLVLLAFRDVGENSL